MDRYSKYNLSHGSYGNGRGTDSCFFLRLDVESTLGKEFEAVGGQFRNGPL